MILTPDVYLLMSVAELPVMMEMLALQVMFVTMEVAAELLLTVTMETYVH